MNEEIKNILNKFSFDEGASSDALEKLKELNLAKDYLFVLKWLNGGEGFVGEEYLILWKAEELVPFNNEYEVNKYAPGIFLFGSNGGGEGFGFDKRRKPYKIVQIPFVGMDLQYATHVAVNFTNLLERMNQSNSPLL